MHKSYKKNKLFVKRNCEEKKTSKNGVTCRTQQKYAPVYPWGSIHKIVDIFFGIIYPQKLEWYFLRLKTTPLKEHLRKRIGSDDSLQSAKKNRTHQSIQQESNVFIRRERKNPQKRFDSFSCWFRSRLKKSRPPRLMCCEAGDRNV